MRTLPSSALLAAVTGALLLIVVPAADATPQPVVYAHRGGTEGDRTTENTLAAFEAAHQDYGASGVWLEMDTQLTGDGALVVLHDAALSETVNGNGQWTAGCAASVLDLTWAEVHECDPDVPLLADVIDRASEDGWRLMIEIKNIPGEANFDAAGAAVATALIDLLNDNSFTDPNRLIVQSFWPPSLIQAEALARDAGFELRSMLLTTSALAGPVGLPAVANALGAVIADIDIVAPDVRSLDLSATVVDLVHALGKEVIVWTADTEASIATAAGWGVDGVITNYPGRAYETLGQ